MAKAKNKSKVTPKPHKKKGGGGFSFGGRGFLNVNLLFAGAVVGGGFVACTMIAPKLGAMASGFTNGYSATPVGQIVIKAGLGLASYALLKKFAPKYANQAAMGMVGSAAVDVYGMIRPGQFMAGTAANPGVAGFFGPGGSMASGTYVGAGLRLGQAA